MIAGTLCFLSVSEFILAVFIDIKWKLLRFLTASTKRKLSSKKKLQTKAKNFEIELLWGREMLFICLQFDSTPQTYRETKYIF